MAFAVMAFLGMGCFFSPAGLAANDDESLGEVRLTLTKLPPPPPAEQKPRVALLLIDCSASMQGGVNGPNAGPTNPQRWMEVRTGLEQTLAQLLAVSPGIEVRLRFFGDRLDCRPPASGKLVQADDVDILMAKVPSEAPKDCGTTSLWESTVRCVEELRRENNRRSFEWWIFGVFSDGENGVDEKRRPPATTTEKERNEQLMAMKSEGAADPLVWIVGPEATKAAGKNAYGASIILKLGDSIPIPPKPKTSFTLDLATGQAAGVQIDHAAKAGRHKLLLSLTGELPAGQPLIVTPELNGTSPFRLLTKSVTIQPGRSVPVELELLQDVDRAKGASATLVFRPSSSMKTDTVSVEGEPQTTFTYTADRTLPPDQWSLIHEPAEKRGVKTLFAATPGQATSPQWVFRHPSGIVEREAGLVVSHSFSTAGTWTCEFACTSESGAKLARQADPIVIVDAEFSIAPPQASIGFDDSAVFQIVRAPNADSPAVFTCLLDGQPVELGADGKTITLPPGNIEQIGRHTLAVVAKSGVGDFEWRSDAAISVKASPRVAIMPSEFVEGRDFVPVTIRASGDIGGAVVVLANGKVISEYPVVYPSADVQIDEIEAKIPTADLTKPELDITVRPKKQGACPEERATLKGRPADIYAAMKSPVSGFKVSAKGGRQLILEPAGNNAGDVGDVEFVVALTKQEESPSGDDLIADEANRWTVAIPRRSNLGLTDVYAKPVGGRLRPDLFPDGKGWRKIGTLEIVPEAQWIPFILWLLGILAVLYFASTALHGNKARHWIVQTTLIDPGANADDEKFDGSISLNRPASSNALEMSGDSGVPSYMGWPRSNWSPRLPVDLIRPHAESKSTTIFLWQLAADYSKAWLRQGISKKPDWEITIDGGRKRMPFLNLPDRIQNGLPWDTGKAYDAFTRGHDIYSDTLRLRSPESRDHSLWIRVKQPKRFRWELWVFGLLIVIAVLLVGYLLKIFHCV